MLNKILGSWIVQLFCIVWAIFLFLDYINHSTYFLQAFHYFEYTGLIITSVIITCTLTYLLANKKKLAFTIEINNFRGIYHYAFTLLFMFLIMLFYINKTGISESAPSGSLLFI